MNKKIATLGLAAVLGLAGVASLPVLAATVFEKKHAKDATPELNLLSEGEGVAKKYYVVKNVDLTGKVSVDGTALAADDFKALASAINGKAAQELKKFPVDTDGNGTLEAAETEAAAIALAQAAPTESAVSAHDEIVLSGTLANILKAIDEIKAGIVAHPDGDLDKAFAKVKVLKLEATDNTVEIKKADADKLDSFAKIAKSARYELSFGKYLTEIKLSGFDVKPEYKSLKMNVTPVFEKATASGLTEENFVAAAKALGVKYDKAVLSQVPGMDADDKLKLGANHDGNNNQQNGDNQNGNNGGNTGGDTNNKPNGTPKTPDTGIAE